MATLIYSATASLDGFIAGPGGDMSWLTPHLGDENPTADRLMARTTALLVGARTFGGDDPNRGTEQEGAFGGQWSGPVASSPTGRPPRRPGASPSSSTCTAPSTSRARPPGTGTSTRSAPTSPGS